MHEPLLGLPLMDLGVTLAGSYGRTDEGSFVTGLDFIDVVLGKGHPKPRGFGASGQVDLERLKVIDPDLIIGMELNTDKAEQLHTVAPVYLQNVSTGTTHGFAVEKDLAELLGKQDAFAARKAAYDARLQAVRSTFPEDPEGKTYLAVFLSDQVNAVGEMSGAVNALEDLGYHRLEIGQDTSSNSQGSTLMMPLSAEVFATLDPDLLIVMNSYMKPRRDEQGAKDSLDQIVPGWNSFLKPARDGRILYLDAAKVTTPTIAAALHTLDAIEAWNTR